MLVGDPGCGKSYLTLDVAARVTTGAAWPDGTAGVSPTEVLLLQAEDGVADTVRPRLDLLGGDAGRVRTIEAVPEANDNERVFSLDTDIQRLRPVLATGLVGLLVIDPLTAYLGDRDSYKDADVRRLLAPVARLAGQTSVAVLAVMHLNKNQEQRALYRIGGSIAFGAASRMVLAVAKDTDDVTRSLFLPLKTNIAGRSSALAFRIDADGRFRWDGTADVDVEQVIGASATAPARRPVKFEAAAAFLRTELATGPRNVSEIRDAAKGCHSWPTVERAKAALGVLTTPRPGGGWVWSLPISSAPGNQPEGR